MAWKRKIPTKQNPYQSDCVSSKTIHGNKSESRLLKDIGARQTIGSGAFNGHRSDGLKEVGDHEFRIECKSTKHESLSLKLEWLQKITKEALQTGKTPILTVSFVRLDGTEKVNGDWVIIPKHLWKEISE